MPSDDERAHTLIPKGPEFPLNLDPQLGPPIGPFNRVLMALNSIVL